jgi:hypothetical protein
LFKRGTFQVRIMTCSSRADYELGVRVADTLARMMNSTVQPEDSEPMSREDAWRKYDDAWIDKLVAWGPDVAAQIVDEKQKTMTMGGPKRPFHLGPRFLAELRAAGPAATLGERLLAAMVAVQSVDERYFAADTMRVAPKGAAAGAGFTMAVWAADVTYLFPDVQHFALHGLERPLFIPASAGPTIAGDKWRYL